jgi:hypothetical protein
LKATRRLLVCNCQQRVPDLRPSVVKVGVVVSAFQMPHEAPFKGKANVKTQFALQTYWGVEVQLLAYLTLALGGGEPFRRSRESCVFKLVQLTPWTRVWFEKLIVAQLVKKSPPFMELGSWSVCSHQPATGLAPEFGWIQFTIGFSFEVNQFFCIVASFGPVGGYKNFRKTYQLHL